ncbi:DUF881 domain-containing protein [Aeromicrobium sp. 636]|uniref:DUF881 domain-containing protein n=1 Tax=Aeromicrobium senzhongii TaxID=2663859 RepID=A0A8I0EU34_9ACTN|nr:MULTISPECIES: DUF881 domain-containing protein [Aeromicrobium]MBC9225080.1 DUF881 domain-containing protein [Aeromicrobium senzhongii]MCQ3997190.1 DUF881 domain-containing protein [Aeromicrobium sp. 636]MTB87129.1 DUF881 domain-containing protein [Aeromicrobium senzhongii]QNL95788.1 DUF881 domain-containing protein [Aeromicrobium senzhongii]
MPETFSLRTALRRRSSWIVGLLIGLLAFTVTVQWREGDETDDFSGVRGIELAELLKSLDATNARLTQQIETLEASRDDLRDSTKSTAEAREAAVLRANALAILSGTVGAEGPGIEITITAPPGAVTASVLLDAVQEMRDAGAEVISLNGVARVVAQTWFLDDDAGVRVSGRLLKPPYVMEVIGDPDTLADAVTFRGGLADRVEGRGGEVGVEERRRIRITAVADDPEPQYARPAND